MAARGPHPAAAHFSRDAEYSAELWLIAKRVLDAEERVIYCEFLLHRRPWFEVDKRTKLGRGQFFHAVYRVEQRLGKALLDSPAFPPAAYFAGIVNRKPEGTTIAAGDVAILLGGREAPKRLREREEEEFAIAA